MRGGIDPAGHRFHPGFFGVVDAWKDFRSGDATLFSRGGDGSANPRLGFHIVRGGMDPGEHRFRPGLVGVVDASIYDPGIRPFLPGWRWLCEPLVGVSTPCVAVSTRGTTAFVPSLLELQRCGRISDPGIGPYPP